MSDSTQDTSQNIDNLSFEEAFSQLSDSVKQLEEGGLTLNEATQLYLSGIRLAAHATELLQKAELQIQTLLQPPASDPADDNG